MNSLRILVTGGTGFIGSHTCVELINEGHEVIILDNLCNSKPEVVDSIKKITGRDLTFYKGDLLNISSIESIFDEHDIDCVIHFAGLKAVGESVEKPIEYYHNNITGTLNLCEVMKKHDCKKIIFSSSATVYGDPEIIPITEDCKKGVCTNPYGWTKSMIEQILTDLHTSDEDWSVILLRYFNPLGAHESGLIGDNPNGIPNNLLPYVMKVALGQLPKLGVFGDDYNTPDGTGVRDYIHVVDLAKGHVKALDKLMSDSDVNIYNLGTGIGYSVLDVIKAFEKANDVHIPYEIKPRRAGDISTCYADSSKATAELGWKAEYDLEKMCKDSWNFAKKCY